MSMTEPFAFAFALDKQGPDTRLDVDGVDARRVAQKPTWVHLDAHADSSRKWLIERALLPSDFLVSALVAEDTRPRCLPLEEGMLLVLRGVNLNEHADPEDMVSVRIWVDQHRLISLTRRPLQTAFELAEKIEQGNGPTSISELLTQVVEASAARLSPVLSDLMDTVDDLEDATLEGNLEEPREHIISVRRKSIMFNRFLMPQRDLIGQMAHNPPTWLAPQYRRRLHEAQDQITRVLEDLHALRDRSQSVQDEIGNLLRERTNQNTYALTLITAIFLPLSFLTGLLGINVEGIPGADDPKAFLVFCGILAAVVAMQLAIFKKLRWF